MLDTLISKIMAGAIGVLLLITLVLGGYNRVLQLEIQAKDTKISELKAANEIMQASIENQNKAIDDLKAKDEDLKKRAEIQVARAHKDAEKYRKKSEFIKNQHVTGDDCQSANALITSYIGG